VNIRDLSFEIFRFTFQEETFSMEFNDPDFGFVDFVIYRQWQIPPDF